MCHPGVNKSYTLPIIDKLLLKFIISIINYVVYCTYITYISYLLYILSVQDSTKNVSRKVLGVT